MSGHAEHRVAQDLPDDYGYDPVMTPRGALVALLVLMFVSTLVEVGAGLNRRGEPVLWSLLTGLLSSFLGFYWFRLDRELRGWPRSRWLGVAIVTITPLAVPYYLARSRPKGRKLRGLAGFVGYVFLMLVASMAGAILAQLMS
ncbi:hypothetical protein [Massilia brevitalea]|uniref:hypothetical protein n=1 Tax=Massilia brevitalea TaxID=442526 RepID=UPI0027391E2F|nr:hypothetical protein [Massilia brevitalea]